MDGRRGGCLLSRAAVAGTHQVPSEAASRPAASPAGVASGPEPASSATSGAARRGGFDVKPKEDLLQLSKLFKAPTTVREYRLLASSRFPACCALSQQPDSRWPHQVRLPRPRCLGTHLSPYLETPSFPSVANKTLLLLQVSAPRPLF